jgi:hypothetical protein
VAQPGSDVGDASDDGLTAATLAWGHPQSEDESDKEHNSGHVVMPETSQASWLQPEDDDIMDHIEDAFSKSPAKKMAKVMWTRPGY